MRMQLLTTGQITMASNGQAYLYDYGLETYQKQTACHRQRILSSRTS